MLPNKQAVVVDKYQHILHDRKRPMANEPDNTISDWPGASPYKAADAVLANKQAVMVGKYQNTLC